MAVSYQLIRAPFSETLISEIHGLAEKVFGSSVTDQIAAKRSWLDLVHPNDRDHLIDAINDLSGSTITEHDFRIIDFDDEVRQLAGQSHRL